MIQRQCQQNQQAQQRHIQPSDPLHGCQNKTLNDCLRHSSLGKAIGTHPRSRGGHIDNQSANGCHQRRDKPEIFAPQAHRRQEDQDQSIQFPDHLVSSTDDPANQKTRHRKQHPAPGRNTFRFTQRYSEPCIEHREGEIRQIIHSPIEPVKAFHRRRHAFHKRKHQQNRQRQRKPLLGRFQPAHKKPGAAVQAEKQRYQNAQEGQSIPLVSKNRRLQGQHKTGNVQPLPVLEEIDRCVPRCRQQAKPVCAVLLNHRMGTRRIDIIVCGRTRVKGQYNRRQQQNHNKQDQPPQPALL